MQLRVDLVQYLPACSAFIGFEIDIIVFSPPVITNLNAAPMPRALPALDDWQSLTQTSKKPSVRGGNKYRQNAGEHICSILISSVKAHINVI